MRDEFSPKVKAQIAARSGHVCSNPKCRQPTSGPSETAKAVTNVGVAAHISAAASGGPRFDATLTSKQRCGSGNGVWLCQRCAKAVDDDAATYTGDVLRAWKREAETAAREAIESGPKQRAPTAAATAGADHADYQLRFVLLQDHEVRPLRTGGAAIELEFRLLNATRPPGEVHNIFGHVWVDGSHFVAATIPPTRGHVGAGHVEWDVQITVFPKEGVFLPAKIAARMPEPGDEILVGAQFVSKETDRQEHLWRIVNEDGVPKTLVVKDPLVGN